MTGPVNPGSTPGPGYGETRAGGYGASGAGGYPSGGGVGGVGASDPVNPGAAAPSTAEGRFGAGRHTSGDEPMQVPARQPWNAGIADPGPLGLTGFATTTMVLSVYNAGLLNAGGEAVVLGLAFFYGGLAQLLAGMWEFVKGNTFGAVAFSSYGAFWLSFWYLVTHEDLIKADASASVGLYLLGWTIFTAYMTIASLRTTGAIALVFVLLTLTYLLLSIGEFATSTGFSHAGGYVGLATAIAAWYASFAGVVNATFRKTVMPTFPMNA